MRDYSKEYEARRIKHKTLEGYLMVTHQRMLRRVRGTHGGRGLHKGLPIVSKEDFIKWSLSNPDYTRLHKEWTDSEYNTRISPSIDRIDNNRGYVFDNMQWITKVENSRKGSYERRTFSNQYIKNK